MKFTATPKAVLMLLDQVSKGLSKRKRGAMQVTFSAARKRVEVSGNGMIAGLSVEISDKGQFAINWKKITDLLGTYPQNTPIGIECTASGLKIGSFCISVENYQSKPVPAKQPIPPVIPLKPSIKKKEEPQLTVSPDGYSPPLPCCSDEESALCPNCLETRLHKGNPIPGRQSDLFEKH